MKKPGNLLSIKITIPLWFILALCCIALVIAHLLYYNQRDNIKFCASILAGAAAIYSAYYVGKGIRLSLIQDKRKASFNLLDRLNSKEFVEVSNFVDTKLNNTKSISDIKLFNMIIKDKELSDSVKYVLSVLEDMSIAIQHDYVDESILHQSMVLIVERNYNALRGYIDHKREITGKTQYYSEFQKLYNAWNSNLMLANKDRD